MPSIAIRALAAVLTFVVGTGVAALLNFGRDEEVRKVVTRPAAPVVVAAGPPTELPPPPPPTKHLSVVSGGVLNNKLVSKPVPAYPPIAKAAKAQGTVVVQILVDEEGNVVSGTAISGHPLLQQAAVAAARHAKLSPTRLSGHPVKVSGVITYNFSLE